MSHTYTHTYTHTQTHTHSHLTYAVATICGLTKRQVSFVKDLIFIGFLPKRITNEIRAISSLRLVEFYNEACGDILPTFVKDSIFIGTFPTKILCD